MLPHQIAGLVDLRVGDVLPDDVPEPLGPGLGGDRQRTVAAALERRDQPLGQAVGADRRDRDLEPLLLEHLHEPADPGIVGHAGPDQPDPIRVLLDLAHRLSQGVEASMADGPVDLPFQAEPAPAAASLPDLEERQMAVLGVRGPEEGHRPELVHLPEPALRHHGRHAVLRPHLRDLTVVPVGHRVALRHVDSLDRRQAVQEVVSPTGAERRRAEGLPVGGHDLADDLLPLAHHHEVHERRDRLRVRERAHAAHQDEGVLRPAVLGPQRDAGALEKAKGVDVVSLVGDREADEVEVRQRPLGLQREGLGAGPPVLGEVPGIGQEHALAHHVRERVQVAVDGLEAEVRHPHGVGVRVDQGERDTAPPVLPDGAGLLREKAVSFFFETPRHAAYSLTDGGRPGKEGTGGAGD